MLRFFVSFVFCFSSLFALSSISPLVSSSKDLQTLEEVEINPSIENNDLVSILKSILNKKSQIYAYCRPNVYYRIEPNATFLERHGIKKVYLYSHYQSKIQEILKTDLSLHATDIKEYEPSIMVLIMFDGNNYHTISIKKEPFNIKDRILIEQKAYLIEQKKLTDTLLDFFCPQIEEIFKQ